MSRSLASALVGAIALSIALAWTAGWKAPWFGQAEKRVRVIVPGQLIRGAWQSPDALRSIIKRERIKTIVTLTAINRDDPKYVEQMKVVEQTGVDWLIVPMRGSRGTVEQIAQATDMLADPARQPVFFHCVAGHHRTSQVHAAYLIRHQGYSAGSAWRIVSELPWARPAAKSDQIDKELIEAFAQHQASVAPAGERDRREVQDELPPEILRQTGRQADRGGRGFHPALHRLGSGEL